MAEVLRDELRNGFRKIHSRWPTEPELDYEVSHFYENPDHYDVTNYTPPGPVARAFVTHNYTLPGLHPENSWADFIMGPVGGGKTTACAMKRMVLATMQPTCRDGWKRCYCVVLRDTFRSAQKTVLQSWLEWFPKGMPGSEWEGGNDRPAVHTMRWELGTGEKVEAVTEFMGLNGEAVEQRLRGKLLSIAWENEADQIEPEALSYLQSQRVGRYPSKHLLPEGVELFPGMVMGDLNAPDIDSYIYEDFHVNPKPSRRLFSQPSGVSAMAENTSNLPKNYYKNIMDNEPDWYVQRFVHNQFGYSRHGLPCFHDTFDMHVHVAQQRLEFDPKLPVIVGADGGLTPASIFMQPQPNGQLRWLRELIPGHGYDAYSHGQLIKAELTLEVPDARDVRAYADPSASYGGGQQIGTELEMLQTGSELPFNIPGDGNNSIQFRLAEMGKEFRGRINNTTPQLLICPSMTTVIKGLASGYMFKKRPAGAGTKYEPLPLKNQYSHPIDGGQYGTIGYRKAPGYFNSGGSGWSSQSAPGDQTPGRAKRGGFNPHTAGLK